MACKNLNRLLEIDPSIQDDFCFHWDTSLEEAGTVLARMGPCVSGEWRQFTHWEAFSRHVTVELCRYIDKHFPAVTALDH
eukprot:s2817_g1.t1